MLQLEEAVERILAMIPFPRTERIALADAHGRVLAEQILSPIELPPFDNSAMDGYAVRAADLLAATADKPVRLRCIGKLAAGHTFHQEIRQGECVRLFTGSMLAQGADAVVMQEDTKVESADATTILLLASAKPWENVRFKGEDIKRGTVLANCGQRLTASLLSLLAAAGVTQVTVGQQPTVGLLATGSELKEPGEPLAPGQIYESNRTGLAALVAGAGGRPRVFPLVPDTLEQTQGALQAAFKECDFVATSGGVSVGEMDFVKAALETSGGDLQFWKVAIKPGRPFVLGHWPDPGAGTGQGVGDSGKKLLFGLPGNPVSALVTFLLLVRPAILKWQGAAELCLPTFPGVLAEPLSNDGARRHFIRVKVDSAGKVVSAGVQASHMLHSLAAANGLVDMPPGTALPQGTIVQVMRFQDE